MAYTKYFPALLLGLMLFFWSWAVNPFSPGTSMRDIRLGVFLFFAGTYAAIHIGKKWHWTIGVFYAYVVGQFAVMGLPPYMMQSVITLSAMLFIAPEIVERLGLRAIENLILAGATINAVMAVLNLFGIYYPPMVNTDYVKPIYGFMGQHTLFAPFMVVAFSFSAWRLRESMLYLVPCAIFFAAVMFAKSSMGYISLGVSAGIFVFWSSSPRIFLALTVAGVILSTAAIYRYPDLAHLSGRQVPWKDSTDIIAGKPIIIENKQWIWPNRLLTGYGIGSWQVVGNQLAILRKSETQWREVHSDILESFFSFGILGFTQLLAAFAVVVFSIFSAPRNPYVPVFFSLLINACANYTLQIVPLQQIFALAVYIIITKKFVDQHHGEFLTTPTSTPNTDFNDQ